MSVDLTPSDPPTPPTPSTPSGTEPFLRFRPPRTPAWVAMYHSVADPADDPYGITVAPERLAGQLRWMRRNGLRGVSMKYLFEACAQGQEHNLVGLTFDDGYRDFVDHALPLLRQHDCTATVFVLPGRLGGENAWDPLGPRKPLLDAEGIRHIAESGMEIASHGLTHVDLTKADDRLLRREVGGSRAALYALTGREVQGFCYPYGHVDARVTAAVREAGYRYACAIAPGALAGPLALPRVHIGQGDSAWRMRLKLRTNRLRRRVLDRSAVFDERSAVFG
ncbi:polysaccharide deacetylase family protein [Streptomyces sp. NPDC058284]|uniref:polysaccharide deacetylase family protein n=1 Tax=unclassified Streptomyces TaxID=2593676 RepID=UPI00364FB2C9